jgi:uncharacterized membrane protein
MHVDVSSETVIDRPLETVWRYASDPDNAPVWYANIESVEWKTAKRIEAGARVAFVAHFLGRRLAYTYEISELVPQVRLVMRTAEGPFPMETIYRWEAVGGNRTRMSLRNRGTPAGLARWLSPLMAVAVRRANRKDLALLKATLEGTAP